MPRKWKNRTPRKKVVAASVPVAQRDNPRGFRCAQASGPLSIEAAAGEGSLPTFKIEAYTGNVMVPSGWWNPVIIDLEGVMVPSQHRPILRQHDANRIVGHSTKIAVDAAGIHVEGVISNPSAEHSREIVETARNQFQWQASVGADPIRTEFLEAGEETTVNGRTVKGPLTISRETELGEISFVPNGADGDTSATVAAQKGQIMNPWKMALKQLMSERRAASQPAAWTDEQTEAMTDAQLRAAMKKCADDGAEAEAAADDSETEEEEDKKAEAARRKRMEANRKLEADEDRRVAAIRATAKRYGVETIEVGGQHLPFAAHAIEVGWSVEKTELEALRLSRPTSNVGVPGGLGYAPGSPTVNDAVLECAVLQAMGDKFPLWDAGFYRDGGNGQRRVTASMERRVTSELAARYPDQVQQAAHTMYRGRIGLQQLLTTIAAASGYRGRETIRDEVAWGSVAQYLTANANRIQADGASSLNVSNLLANVQNKLLLVGYFFVEQAFLKIAPVRPVTDFKPLKDVALFSPDAEFAEIGANGEITNASLADQAFSNQAKMQAKMFTLPLTHIVNDDLGGFGQVPIILGRGWGLRVNKLVWTKFLNPGNDEGGSTAFWAATHTITGQVGNSNYISGGGSTLTSAGLQTGKQTLDKQVDPGGNPLGLDAEILLYPPELDTAATELMNSQFIIMAGLASTSAASKQPTNNIWKGRYEPVMSRYLSNSAYTGYSATAWYLLVNPAVMPVIQIAAWNGQMVPTVQTAGQDFQFNVLGISMRAFGGVGVEKQNFRGGVKSAGA
jgi:hypothetical protein